MAVYGFTWDGGYPTLTMIYIILGLGLNVVVGLLVCWCWDTAAFTPSALTLLRAQSLLRFGLLDLSADCRVNAAAAGFLLGFPVLRLRGDYLRSLPSVSAKLCAYCCSITPNYRRTERYQSDPETDALRTRVSRTAREGGWDTFSNFFGLKTIPPIALSSCTWWRCC